MTWNSLPSSAVVPGTDTVRTTCVSRSSWVCPSTGSTVVRRQRAENVAVTGAVASIVNVHLRGTEDVCSEPTSSALAEERS